MSLLTGSLEAFTVQEVLGLVGSKSGQWLVAFDDVGRDGYVGLRDGHVTCASSDTAGNHLIEALADADDVVGLDGVAPDQRLETARAILRSSGADREAVVALLRAYTVDSIARLMLWNSGTFAARHVAGFDHDMGISYPLADLGADISARAAELRELAAQAGAQPAVQATMAGEVSTEDLLASVEEVKSEVILGTGAADGDNGEVWQPPEKALPSDDDLLAILLRGVRGV